ncbi:MAG: transcription antitermination factor NusB [Pseudomonadota bacterium]
MSDTEIPLNPRQVARRLALQALYAWLLTQNALRAIELDVIDEQATKKPCDRPYLHELLEQIPIHQQALENSLARYSSRALSAVSPVERAILLIGAYDLCHRLEIPLKVAINEAVDLAKTYGATDGYRFINGVLDKLAEEVRSPKAPQGK